MADEFKLFSDAARLYAKYIGVVKEMKEAYKANLEAYLDVLADRLSEKASPLVFRAEDHPKSRSWWLESDETAEKLFEEFVPYVWIESQNSEMIVPGILTLVAEVNEGTDQEWKSLGAVRRILALPNYCKIVDSRELFQVQITYGEGDPVDAAVEPTMAVMNAMYSVGRENILARKNSSQRSKKGS